MQIKLDKDETDILDLIGARDSDLRAKAEAVHKQGRALGRKIQRFERERQSLRQKLLNAVRRKRPDLTIPDQATPSADGHGNAFLMWSDPVPDRQIPEKPVTLAEIVDPAALAKACGDPAPAEVTPAAPTVAPVAIEPAAATNGACAHG